MDEHNQRAFRILSNAGIVNEDEVPPGQLKSGGERQKDIEHILDESTCWWRRELGLDLKQE